MWAKLAILALAAPAAAFDYSIVGAGSVLLTDAATSISGLETLFVDQEVFVTADGLEWESNDSLSLGGNIFYETFLNGELVASGNMTLDGVGRELPSSIDVGSVIVKDGGGRYTIEVMLTVDESEATTSGEYEAYGSGVAIIPLLVIIVLAVMTNMVRLLSLSEFFLNSKLTYNAHRCDDRLSSLFSLESLSVPVSFLETSTEASRIPSRTTS
jgi:hypothetical protein